MKRFRFMLSNSFSSEDDLLTHILKVLTSREKKYKYWLKVETFHIRNSEKPSLSTYLRHLKGNYLHLSCLFDFINNFGVI